MPRTITTVFALAALVGSSGCSVAYSSIRKQDDGNYLLTESKSRFFKVEGTCTAASPTHRPDMHGRRLAGAEVRLVYSPPLAAT